MAALATPTAPHRPPVPPAALARRSLRWPARAAPGRAARQEWKRRGTPEAARRALATLERSAVSPPPPLSTVGGVSRRWGPRRARGSTLTAGATARRAARTTPARSAPAPAAAAPRSAP